LYDIAKSSVKFIEEFMNSSPFAGKLCYTENTNRKTVGKADAVEISADNPTVYP
jgi:hypothetical protein